MKLSFGRAVIPVTDQDRALRFYTEILGCTLLHDGPGPNGLRFVHVGFTGQENVGLWLFQVDQTPSSNEPTAVIYTDNLSEAYKYISEAGDFVFREPSENDTSRYMHISDPDHNIIVVAELL